MIRLVITLAAVATLSEAVRCPAGYTLMGGGRCVRPLSLWVKGTLDSLLPDMINQCEKDNAHLPIIKSAQDNEMFNYIVKTFEEIEDKAVFLMLGMVCNEKTRRLEWADKSPINYLQKPLSNLDFNCVDEAKHVVSRVKFDDWFVVPDDATLYTYTFICEIDPDYQDLRDVCGEYEQMNVSNDFEKQCIKVFTEPRTWKEASDRCAEDFAALATISTDNENSYIRRAANSKGVVGGLHIGAHEVPVGSGKWKWVDGEISIGKSDYNNFIGGLPAGGGNSCSAMSTDSSSAQWKNVDCDSNKLPFVCRRIKYPSLQKTCPEVPPQEGVDFFPPGFPHSSVPCEYILSVADGKRVQLEVITLEANEGADNLALYEGVFGAQIAYLSGTTPHPNTFKTSKGNVMKVSWEPIGAINVRGFRLRYTAVDT